MADSIITKQELIDAQKDAQTLEEVISGEPGKLVETRLGRKVYTLASVPQINTMTREEIDTAVASRAPQATTYTKIEVDSALSTKAPQATTYTKAEVDTTFAAYVGGRKAYTTLALAQAGQSSLPANTAIEVTNDGANNGTYQWNGTALTKSAYDPLTQAKADATTKANAAELSAINKTENQLQAGNGLNNFVGAGIIPIITDENNNILLGYNPLTQEFVGNLLDKLAISSSLNLDGLYNFIGSGVIPFFTDSNNKIIMGYDPASEKIIGSFDSAAIKSNLFFDYGQYIAAINHLMTYGQSLSTGSGSLPLLSLSQPNQNLKFIGGIRGNTEFESTVPLIEDERRDQGVATNGETPVSGAANYAVMSAYRDNGVSADKHVVLGSASGIGGSRLEFLAKGTLQYDQHLLAHIRGGASLNLNYAYQATMWLQGESDELTDYATYKNMFYKLITDIATDVRKISKQTFDPAFITYQTSAYSSSTATPAKAQLEAIKDGKAFLSCPVYRLNVLNDGLHLTNASSKLMGCYFGRVYKQLVVDKRKPDWLEPLSTSITGNIIRVKFKVPKLPLVFDTISMGGGQITNYGFAITNDANVKQTISTVAVDGDTVVITLASTPSEPLKVRYALDYAPSFIGNSVKGGRGNLRDSTDDMVTIDGIVYQMFHVAPHFEMNIKTLEV